MAACMACMGSACTLDAVSVRVFCACQVCCKSAALAARGNGKSVKYHLSTIGLTFCSMGKRSLSAMAPSTAWVVG